jgi:hypothetical protein
MLIRIPLAVKINQVPQSSLILSTFHAEKPNINSQIFIEDHGRFKI